MIQLEFFWLRVNIFSTIHNAHTFHEPFKNDDWMEYDWKSL